MVFKDRERAAVNGNWMATCQGKIYEKKSPPHMQWVPTLNGHSLLVDLGHFLELGQTKLLILGFRIF